MSARKRAALQALAEQDESPLERDIAREKLAALDAREAREEREFLTWQQREAIAAEERRLAEEAAIADRVRRWEQGAFAGVQVKAGAVTKVSYPKDPKR